jgi:DNA-directed RNA polymerase subunit RPC12/RpoP
MTTRVERALRPGSNSFRFPHQCTYCGRPARGTLPFTIQLKDLIKVTERAGAREKTYLQYQVPLKVPYCSQHLTTARRIRVAYWAILLLGAAGMAAFFISFIAGLSLTNEQVVLAGAVALCLWVPASRVFVVAVDWVLSRFIPAFAATAPIQPLALSWELTKKPRKIIFAFANREIARQFHELNGGARPRPPVRRAAPSPRQDERRAALLRAQAWWRANRDPKEVALGTYICDACGAPILDKEGTSLVGSWMRCKKCTHRLFPS